MVPSTADFDFLGVRNDMNDPDVLEADFGGLPEIGGVATTGDWNIGEPPAHNAGK